MTVLEQHRLVAARPREERRPLARIGELRAAVNLHAVEVPGRDRLGGALVDDLLERAGQWGQY